ncbi:MAG: DNA-binding protein [Candidatus Schekmanbacteria bacterium]|nr:DNA-binding protein [Candidatus Schekmanbacteria bacterium]
MKFAMKLQLSLFLCLLTLNYGTLLMAAQGASDSITISDMNKATTEVPTIVGKVVETFNSGGYTYVLLEKNGKKTWVAAPVADVKVGEEVVFQAGNLMPSFTSKTLNRTFENIIFSPGVVGKKGVTSQPSKLSTTESHTQTAKSVEKIKVSKASGPNAYTVSELYEKSKQLDNKNVVVKGKVVKVSPGIMKKNWVHLQDGTGSDDKKNNDIVVTTQDMPSVGDVVVASGILYKDKDFGSGYKYSVIVENAKISK